MCTMKAIVCSELGGPENLTLGELPDPQIGAGQVLVKVSAAGVNFPDTLIIQGKYQLKPPLPFAPGFEIAGTVVQVGEGVKRYGVGDRLAGLTSCGYGAFAEMAVTDQIQSVKIPATMDDVTATAFYTAYGTSYHALVQRGRIQAGDTLVVLGASGGVGVAAVEIGLALGARVIAVASSADKAAFLRSRGVEQVIDLSVQDLRVAVKEMTGGAGADVCLDTVGGDAFDAMSRCMAWDGRLLVVGFASGRIPSLAVNLVLLKGYQLVGVWWGPFVERRPEVNRANFDHLFKLYADGKLRPHVSRVVPLERCADALGSVLSRNSVGRTVIKL